MKKSVLLKWIAAGCGLVAVLMIFLPFVAISEGGESESWNGLKVIFGSEDDGYAFSFMALLTVLMAIIGATCCAVGAKKSDDKILPLVGAGVLALAGILFFCMTNFVQLDTAGSGLSGTMLDAVIAAFREVLDLGIGAIIAGIACLGGATCSVVSVVLKNKEK